MTTFEIIKILAKKRNMNMKQAATAIGFSENAFYKWKTSSPSVENLEKVANFFDVSVDYLLDREKTEAVEDHKVQTIAAHIDDDVTEEQMEDILNYIEFIKQKHSKKD